MSRTAPSNDSIAKTLGAAQDVWDAILVALRAEFGALAVEWKASKSEFGWMCVLKRGARTLVYLTPENGGVRIGVVLGERAAKAAMASPFPEEIKALIADARPYAEGRGFRFVIKTTADIPVVTKLVALKISPQSKDAVASGRKSKRASRNSKHRRKQA